MRKRGGDEGGREGKVLGSVEMRTDEKPLGRVAENVIAIEEEGEHGRHASAVLGEPVVLEDAERRRHASIHGLLVLATKEGESGKVGERQSVERGLLAVQEEGNGAVEVGAADESNKRDGRRAQLVHGGVDHGAAGGAGGGSGAGGGQRAGGGGGGEGERSGGELRKGGRAGGRGRRAGQTKRPQPTRLHTGNRAEGKG